MPLVLLLALLAPPHAAPGGAVEVAVEGLRNERGLVHFCLTRDPRHFPDCAGDPDARSTSVDADAARIRFTGLPAGDYALSVVHDENGNGRLDSFAGIPREGFGFSRNPAIRFGPPRFVQAVFPVARNPVRQTVRIRYIL